MHFFIATNASLLEVSKAFERGFRVALTPWLHPSGRLGEVTLPFVFEIVIL